MVAKNDLRVAARFIEDALKTFVHEGERDKVHVFESDWGHLRAIVGSARFENMSIGERQETVWKHLREHVDTKYRVQCYGVQTMDIKEYEEASLPRSVSGSMSTFIEGEAPIGEDADE